MKKINNETKVNIIVETTRLALDRKALEIGGKNVKDDLVSALTKEGFLNPEIYPVYSTYREGEPYIYWANIPIRNFHQSVTLICNDNKNHILYLFRLPYFEEYKENTRVKNGVEMFDVRLNLINGEFISQLSDINYNEFLEDIIYY